MSRRDPHHSEQATVAPQRLALLIALGVALVSFLFTAVAALGAEVHIVFEGEEDAFSELWLDVPENFLDGGAPVEGRGVMEPFGGPDAGCILEFEFHGTVQPSSTEERTEIRGVVDRTRDCGAASPRRDAGEFDVTIQQDGSVTGTVTFPDEAEPLRMTEYVAAPDPAGSTTGDLVLSALFAVAAVVGVTATGVCLLKGKRMWFIFGLAVSILMVLFTMEAGNVDTDAGLEAALLFYAFVIVGAPLTGLLLMGAFRPAKPTSWWAKRGPSGYSKAPPPEMPRADLGHDEP